MADPLLHVRGIVAGYGKIDVLHGVDVDVYRGQVVSLIGPNGAGKSTVLKVVTGFLPPRAGRVRFAGRDISGTRADRLVPLGLAYVPQGRVVFPRMTVQENLDVGAFCVADPGLKRSAFERVYTLFPRLAERRTQQAGTLSGGEQQMLAIGRGLMIDPRLLLLDEPSLGLAPRFVTLVFETLAALKEQGLSMIVVEQNAAQALAISDQAYLLELGRNKLSGSGQELLANPELRRLYLGT
ncbi:MAG TPA: ABC transporter ATP-binding protein [Chloroflexota bacterium]|nr:ABC transporter ATP-binding protein [Chloroflexota bacterium]